MLQREIFRCKATIKTSGDAVVSHSIPDHTHAGNIATARARAAVGAMKVHMQENVATPSASQGAVVSQVADSVKMALPKRASLSRMLRHHRQVQRQKANG